MKYLKLTEISQLLKIAVKSLTDTASVWKLTRFAIVYLMDDVKVLKIHKWVFSSETYRILTYPFI